MRVGPMLNLNGTIATLHKFLPHLTVNLLPKGNTLRHFYNSMFPVFPHNPYINHTILLVWETKIFRRLSHSRASNKRKVHTVSAKDNLH